MSAVAQMEQQTERARGRVALLQNQSEMRHNAWADARNQLTELCYEWSLFTSEAVEELAAALTRDRFDALVIGSNALNDQNIRTTLESRRFCSALDIFLAQGRGLIVLHQMGLATSRAELSILPSPWNKVSAVVREDGEEASIGWAGGADTHPVMLFPESVLPHSIVDHALSYSPLRASWFHFWSGVTQDAWTPLLRADGETGDERALVAIARDPAGRRRIALCSPPADWQRPPALLPNLLFYACRGSVPAAIISPTGGHPGLDLVETWLASERVPFEHYDAADLERIPDRLRQGVHGTVLLGPDLDFEQLDPRIREELEAGLREGRLRLLGFGTRLADRRRLWAASSRLSVADAIRPLEAQAVAALETGRVDGSFWSTVETLQVLRELPGAVTDVDPDLAGPAIADAMESVRDGSHHGTPAATCALLWLLHTFQDPRVEQTAQWLRGVVDRDIPDIFPGEAIMALTMLRQTDRGQPSDDERLDALLDAAVRLDELRDHDLLVALHAVQVAGRQAPARELARELIRRQEKDGGWVDLETTATIVRRLASVHAHQDAIPGLERALVRAAFHIRDAARLDRDVPWANRISTSLLCVHALALVNDVLDIPISDTVDALQREHHAAEFKDAGEAAARAAEALRRSNDALRRELDEARIKTAAISREAAKAESLRAWRNWLGVSLAAAVYLCVALLVDGFSDDVGVHATVLAALFGAGFALPRIVNR